METTTETFRCGHVELDADGDWPEGVRVTVAPVEQGIGLQETDWPDTPENRTALVAKLQEIEPLEMTPEEEAEWNAAREGVRQATLAAVRRPMGLS